MLSNLSMLFVGVVAVATIQLVVVSEASKFVITNNCPYTVWPATLTADQKPQLGETGFELRQGQTREIDVPRPWKGRIWGRTHCNWQGPNFVCKTGDCGGRLGCAGAGGVPPVSLVELNMMANGGQDFYDISHVDGTNIPIQVTLRGGHGGDCKHLTCRNDMNHVCPAELQVKHDGRTVACKSACTAWGNPRDCCPGMTPEQCPPSDYSRKFKQNCPDAYSYAYDDPSSIHTCFGNPDYMIKFCP